MKKPSLLLALMLVSPLTFSADDVEESPPAYGCAGCSNNQTMNEAEYRSQMDSAAAAAEAQRAMQAEQAARAQQAAQNKKTPAEIEKETRKKWCADTLANIPIAISKCRTEAKATFSRQMYFVCKGETSKTIEGGITVYFFGGTVSSTTSCSATYEAEREATLSRCETDGLILERTVTDQCKGL